ncbi:hypothetical protein FKM82_019553 [Ascaphus truei]
MLLALLQSLPVSDSVIMVIQPDRIPQLITNDKRLRCARILVLVKGQGRWSGFQKHGKLGKGLGSSKRIALPVWLYIATHRSINSYPFPNFIYPICFNGVSFTETSIMS